MFTTRSLILGSLVLSLAAQHAYADAAADKQRALSEESSGLGAFVTDLDMMHKKGIDTPAQYTKAEVSKCTAVIAKNADVKPDDTLTAAAFKSWPGATKASTGNSYSIAASQAGSICDAYGQLRAALVAMQKYPLGKDYEMTRHTIDAKDYDRTMNVPDGKAGQTCVDHVDAAIKDGAPHDVSIHFNGGDSTLDELKASCQTFITDNAKAVGDVKTKIAAENAEIAAVYQKAGIKGDRLKLFAAAGKPEASGFYFAGCANGPTTAAEMKKAKKLFTWSEGDAGIIVTRYAFRGDKYTTSARTFDRKDSAYRWCK